MTRMPVPERGGLPNIPVQPPIQPSWVAVRIRGAGLRVFGNRTWAGACRRASTALELTMRGHCASACNAVSRLATGRRRRRRVWRPRSRSRLRRSGRPGCRRALELNRQRRNSSRSTKRRCRWSSASSIRSTNCVAICAECAMRWRLSRRRCRPPSGARCRHGQAPKSRTTEPR